MWSPRSTTRSRTFTKLTVHAVSCVGCNTMPSSGAEVGAHALAEIRTGADWTGRPTRTRHDSCFQNGDPGRCFASRRLSRVSSQRCRGRIVFHRALVMVDGHGRGCYPSGALAGGERLGDTETRASTGVSSCSRAGWLRQCGRLPSRQGDCLQDGGAPRLAQDQPSVVPRQGSSLRLDAAWRGPFGGLDLAHLGRREPHHAVHAAGS